MTNHSIQLIYKCSNCNEIIKQVKHYERINSLEEIAELQPTQIHACNDNFNPLALRGILVLIGIGYTDKT